MYTNNKFDTQQELEDNMAAPSRYNKSTSVPESPSRKRDRPSMRTPPQNNEPRSQAGSSVMRKESASVVEPISIFESTSAGDSDASAPLFGKANNRRGSMKDYLEDRYRNMSSRASMPNRKVRPASDARPRPQFQQAGDVSDGYEGDAEKGFVATEDESEVDGLPRRRESVHQTVQSGYRASNLKKTPPKTKAGKKAGTADNRGGSCKKTLR